MIERTCTCMLIDMNGDNITCNYDILSPITHNVHTCT